MFNNLYQKSENKKRFLKNNSNKGVATPSSKVRVQICMLKLSKRKLYHKINKPSQRLLPSLTAPSNQLQLVKIRAHRELRFLQQNRVSWIVTLITKGGSKRHTWWASTIWKSR